MKETIQSPEPKEINASKSDPVIDVQNLRKSFGNTVVLDNVSLQLFGEENLVVLGKSGTGKSVLIKCIVRLLASDSGKIKVLGANVPELNKDQLSELRLKIGFLFQGGALYDSMTVKENLEFPLRRIKKHLKENEIKDKVLEVLENVKLSEALNKMPSELSGGMRKRISLARTIIVDPSIILYDEPTTGLDPVTSDEISELILEVQQKYKAASMIITHDIKCARNTAQRVLMLDGGHVYKVGKMEEFERSDDPLIKSFFT